MCVCVCVRERGGKREVAIAYLFVELDKFVLRVTMYIFNRFNLNIQTVLIMFYTS